MAARLDSVCKYICEKSNWELTNLELQKILYLAQMFHMGRQDGARLFDGNFEAWDYGPVEPSLYKRTKLFGADKVKDVFYGARNFKPEDPRRQLLDEVCHKFLKYSAGDLVNITHWDDGAWAKHYVPKSRNVRIPDEHIWQEYRDRQVGAKSRQSGRLYTESTSSAA